MKKKDSIAKARTLLDRYLTTNNHRKTPERYAILDAIETMSGHFTLDELGAKLTDELRFPVVSPMNAMR